MPDYQPLDLSDLCNAGLDVLDEKPNTPIGEQLCRGLPFRVNDDPAKCFIAFDKASGGVTIPVNSRATGLILAHRLLKSDLMEGGPLGIPVAEYVFRLAGGKGAAEAVRRSAYPSANALKSAISPWGASLLSPSRIGAR